MGCCGVSTGYKKQSAEILVFAVLYGERSSDPAAVSSWLRWPQLLTSVCIVAVVHGGGSNAQANAPDA